MKIASISGVLLQPISKPPPPTGMQVRFLSLLSLAFFLLSLPQAAHAADTEGEADERYTDRVMHHIADANEFHILGDWHVPLPVIAWSQDDGLVAFMSSSFYARNEHAEEHDEEHTGVDQAVTDEHHMATEVVHGYILDHGELRRLADPAARASLTSIESVGPRDDATGASSLVAFSGGQAYALDAASTLLNWSGWIDFSITKNVVTMLFAMLVFALIFLSVRSGYTKNEGRAPSGIQSFFEPIILFVRDDIAKQMIGPKYERYFPFLCTLFFFILIINMFGLIPFAPFGANVTGNIGMTFALAFTTFLVVNFSGNRDYWGHVFWMPGVPIALKPLMALIEVLGLFIKPFTLMIRLFANITAGHIIILSLIGLIFLFGDNGESIPGTIAGAGLAIPFVFVMNLLEIFVAFLQAFIFTLLSALYIGSAVEEHHVEHGEHGAPHVPA